MTLSFCVGRYLEGKRHAVETRETCPVHLHAKQRLPTTVGVITLRDQCAERAPGESIVRKKARTAPRSKFQFLASASYVEASRDWPASPGRFGCAFMIVKVQAARWAMMGAVGLEDPSASSWTSAGVAARSGPPGAERPESRSGRRASPRAIRRKRPLSTEGKGVTVIGSRTSCYEVMSCCQQVLLGAWRPLKASFVASLGWRRRFERRRLRQQRRRRARRAGRWRRRGREPACHRVEDRRANKGPSGRHGSSFHCSSSAVIATEASPRGSERGTRSSSSSTRSQSTELPRGETGRRISAPPPVHRIDRRDRPGIAGRPRGRAAWSWSNEEIVNSVADRPQWGSARGVSRIRAWSVAKTPSLTSSCRHPASFAKRGSSSRSRLRDETGGSFSRRRLRETAAGFAVGVLGSMKATR